MPVFVIWLLILICGFILFFGSLEDTISEYCGKMLTVVILASCIWLGLGVYNIKPDVTTTKHKVNTFEDKNIKYQVINNNGVVEKLDIFVSTEFVNRIENGHEWGCGINFMTLTKVKYEPYIDIVEKRF